MNVRGEDQRLADELALGILGDGDGVAAGAGGAADESALGRRGPAAVADVGQFDFAVVGVCGGADEHAEALFESGRFAAGDIVDIETAVVDELALGAAVTDLGDTAAKGLVAGMREVLAITHVGAVLCLEEHDCSPVVGLVLHEIAAGASRELGRILAGVHGDVEGVASHDLVEMGSVLHAWIDKGICPLDNKLRASKPQHVLSSSILCENRSSDKSGPLHRD
jgi:hypothetical protein